MTPTVHPIAKLVPFRDGSEHARIQDGSWFITHGFGGPAERTYTEVSFAPEALTDTDGRPLPSEVLIEAVRSVAQDLYRDAYAFIYPPEQALEAVQMHGLRRRERVHVSHIDVW